MPLLSPQVCLSRSTCCADALRMAAKICLQAVSQPSGIYQIENQGLMPMDVHTFLISIAVCHQDWSVIHQDGANLT